MFNPTHFNRPPSSERGTGVRPDTKTEKEYERATTAFTDAYLDRKIVSPEDVKDQAEKIRKEFPKLADGRIYFIEAAAWNERSNERNIGSLVHLEREAKKLGIPILSMTQQQVGEIMETYTEKDILENEEHSAINAYDKATRSNWKSRFFETSDAESLRMDLQARMIQRGQSPKRDTELEQLENKLARYITEISNVGKRNELRLIYLLRRWARLANVSHLVFAEHGLPREDVRQPKVDIRLVNCSKLFNLQLKSTHEEHSPEFKKELENKTRKQLLGTTTFDIYLDWDDLQEAVKLLKTSELDSSEKRRATALKNKILAGISKQFNEQQRVELYGALSPAKKEPTKEKKASKLTIAGLQKNSPVPRLIEFGLLQASESGKPQAILEAKKKVTG
jgi:hypothetical protein